MNVRDLVIDRLDPDKDPGRRPGEPQLVRRRDRARGVRVQDLEDRRRNLRVRDTRYRERRGGDSRTSHPRNVDTTQQTVAQVLLNLGDPDVIGILEGQPEEIDV